MRHGVMPLDRASSRRLKAQSDVLSDCGRIASFEDMDPGVASFARLSDSPTLPIRRHLARVAHLSAHLRIQHGVVQNDRGPPLRRCDFLHIRTGVVQIVAEKVGRRSIVALGEFDGCLLLRTARPRTLLLHQFLEADRIDRQPAFTRHQLGQIQRETLLVV